MRFTQRQAAGKFTRDEATAFIDQLQLDQEEGISPVADPGWRLTAQDKLVRQLPTELLAAELRRRGWTVTEP